MSFPFPKNPKERAYGATESSKSASKSHSKSASETNVGRPLIPQNAGGVDPVQDAESQLRIAYESLGPPAGLNDGPCSGRIDARVISDCIIGIADGLTVPFAVSVALYPLGDTKLVDLAGLADLAAGAVSMGLGGYVGAGSEMESYEAKVRGVQELIRTYPHETMGMVRGMMLPYGQSELAISNLNHSLHEDPKRIEDFIIKRCYLLKKPEPNRPFVSSLSLGLGYFAGGLTALSPYFFVDNVGVALCLSIGTVNFALLAFGYIKTAIIRGWKGSQNVVAGIKGAVKMCVIVGIAVVAAVALVWGINDAKY